MKYLKYFLLICSLSVFMFANDEEEIQTIEIDGIIYKINPGSLNITPCNDCPVESNDNKIVEESNDRRKI